MITNCPKWSPAVYRFRCYRIPADRWGRFLIDPDGVVQGFEVLTPPVGRNVSETIRQIQAFQLVRKSKGTEAAPSGWKPGKITLKPGPDLVGKVWEVWKTDMAFD
jgi:alkyl hydroperoxide reductase subunit AhpC